MPRATAGHDPYMCATTMNMRRRPTTMVSIAGAVWLLLFLGSSTVTALLLPPPPRRHCSGSFPAWRGAVLSSCCLSSRIQQNRRTAACLLAIRQNDEATNRKDDEDGVVGIGVHHGGGLNGDDRFHERDVHLASIVPSDDENIDNTVRISTAAAAAVDRNPTTSPSSVLAPYTVALVADEKHTSTTTTTTTTHTTGSSTNTTTTTTPIVSLLSPFPTPPTPFNNEIDIVDALKLQYAIYDLTCAALVGIMTGVMVAIFKLAIDAVRLESYSLPILDIYHEGAVFIPLLGGFLVGTILLFGKLPPGLRGQVNEVDEFSRGPLLDLQSRYSTQLQSLRKTLAAVVTLGTGNSLGPEGPCVELGMGIARSWMDLTTEHAAVKRRVFNRVLLSCGAAAGVAAGFDAPLAGVFFALEVMQSSFTAATQDQRKKGEVDIIGSEGLFASTSTITPVVISSVLSALCARSILGEHLTFQVAQYAVPTPLIELPIYLLLGAVSGGVAFSFSQAAKLSKSFFDGKVGNINLRAFMKTLSPSMKPVLGGLFCGILALAVPQILFFGYETLNPLLSKQSMPTSVLITILFAKAVATAVSIGSGLVGGTFAPALFLGGMTGASFFNFMACLYHEASMILTDLGIDQGSTLVLADLPSYAMVGSASVLAALFRAPLTASLLLFELSREYDVILPLIASAGVGSVVADILEDKFEREKEFRRDRDSASWGDLSSDTVDNKENRT